MTASERATVSIRPVVRRQFRLEWSFDLVVQDSLPGEEGDVRTVRVTRVRHVNRKADAYRMAAMRLIVSRRDTFATGFDAKGLPSGCSLCAGYSLCCAADPEEPAPVCRYHGGEGFETLRNRLAR